MENRKRVVITGMGVVSPFGTGLDVLWDSLLKGKSAVGRITKFDPEGFGAQIAAEVKDFDPLLFLNRKDAKRYDPFLQFAKAAVKMCMDDSGIQVDEELASFFGVSIGSGIGGMQVLEDTHKNLLEKGPSRISPFFIPMMLVNMASGVAAMDYNLRGPNLSMVTACATGAHNIGISYEMIQSGKVTAMLAGGAEASITPLTIAGFSSMKAVSFSNDEPEKASRPFDMKRNGFVMGEGSAIMLLEELEHALARDAKIYAEIIGFGASSDAYHITQPEPEGRGAAHAMRMALAQQNTPCDRIDYINAHGTATPLGDIAETKAIKEVFGEHAGKLAVSSTKSMIGHLLGAAGAIEGIVTVLSVKNDKVTPTINLDEPDPQCDLDYVPNTPRDMKVDYALSNSFGFGGTNSVLAFKKFTG